MGLKTWLSFEPEKEVQSPGQNQLGVVEDKVQGSRLLTGYPPAAHRGYFDTKNTVQLESTIAHVLVRPRAKGQGTGKKRVGRMMIC